MDHTRDNPLKRFKAFWIALLLVFSFGVALILLRPLTHGDNDGAMDITAKGRLETKEAIDREQSQALNTEGLESAYAEQLKTFAENKMTKGAMPVPGAAPAPAPEAPAGDKPAPEAETKPAPAAE
ncbi:MAG: hypothetical protein PVJ98_00135 [Akkermansiaceae bacterium]|jgi:hypothetical protein